MGGILGGGGGDQASAAKDATKAQVQASQQQIALYKDIFNKQLQLETPQYNVGTQALQYLGGMYGFPINQSPYPITPLGQNMSFGGGSGTPTPSSGPADYTQANLIGPQNEVNPATGNNRDWVRHCSVHPDDPVCAAHFKASSMASGGGAPGTGGTVATSGQQLPTAQQYQQNFNALIQADPGYNFRLQQGQQALDRQAAAGGRLFSGAQIKAGARYNQDYASNEFGNAYNRLASLAGLQQTSTGQINNQLQNLGTQTGQALGNIGDARASGYINQAQAGQNSFNNLLNLAGTGIAAYGAFAA